jgi:hypothetical protein
MRTIYANAGRKGGILRLHYDETLALDQDVQLLASNLEGLCARGAVYKGGETIQIGWTLVRLEARGRNLELTEPDWTGNVPIKFVPSVTSTVVHLRQQKDVADSLSLSESLAIPVINQSAIVCSRLESGLGVMSRQPGEGSDSGWFLGCGDPGHDHNDSGELRRVSLYEAACAVRASIKFFALPPGIEISFDSVRRFTVLFDGEECRIRPGSYLADLADLSF